MANALTWFEIPTLDLDRAVRFYESVLGVRLKREVFGGVPHAMFPAGQSDAGGALIQDGRRQPSTGGTLIYLDVAGKLDACVERIRGAGVPHLRGRGRGDLYVHVQVQTPTDLTPEQEELLRQFAAARGEAVAPPGTGRGEGVFSRLRSAFG